MTRNLNVRWILSSADAHAAGAKRNLAMKWSVGPERDLRGLPNCRLDRSARGIQTAAKDRGGKLLERRPDHVISRRISLPIAGAILVGALAVLPSIVVRRQRR